MLGTSMDTRKAAATACRKKYLLKLFNLSSAAQAFTKGLIFYIVNFIGSKNQRCNDNSGTIHWISEVLYLSAVQVFDV